MPKKAKTLFIISLIITLISFFLYAILYISLLNSCNNIESIDKDFTGLNIAIILIIILIFGSLISGLCTILNIVCFIITLKSSDFVSKRIWCITQFIFIFIPYLIELTTILLIKAL